KAARRSCSTCPGARRAIALCGSAGATAQEPRYQSLPCAAGRARRLGARCHAYSRLNRHSRGAGAMTDSPMTPFHEMAGKSPEEAKFFWTGGPIEVAPRTWFQSLLSGVTAFETDEGLVLVDSG